MQRIRSHLYNTVLEHLIFMDLPFLRKKGNIFDHLHFSISFLLSWVFGSYVKIKSFRILLLFLKAYILL